jgi:Bax protein
MRPPILTPLQRTLARGVAAAAVVVAVTVAADFIWPPDHLSELPPLAPQVTSDQRLIVGTPDQLARAFDRAGYDLDAIRKGNATVPYLLLREWPEGFEALRQTDEKKALFKRALLPLILHVNRTFAAQREALLELLRRRQAGDALSHRERVWLRRLAVLYRTTPDNTATLLRRVAPIPPSLAIAQAATETGWGASRFARDGNALFGQWTFDEEEGLRPMQARASARHAVKAYDRLVESAWDYARNLNTNRAYRGLRDARAAGIADGMRLAGALERYSQRGTAYVGLIRDVIRQNGLLALDQARLREPTIPAT